MKVESEEALAMRAVRFKVLDSDSEQASQPLRHRKIGELV